MAASKHPYDWIEKATAAHPGKLREKLHAKPGQPIPEKKLRAAEHSKSPAERKEADLAAALKKMHGK